MHKFENLTGAEDIYTIRVSSFSTACDSILANDMVQGRVLNLDVRCSCCFVKSEASEMRAAVAIG